MFEEKEITRENNPMFFKLWDIKSIDSFEKLDNPSLKDWYDYEIYAKTTKDINSILAGTKVRVWMVSRFGDLGITDNLINPTGYDVRGIDADEDLVDYEFIEK
jgi:hypothetical protein